MEDKKLVSVECHEYFKNLRRATNFNIERSNTLLVANESAIKAATEDFKRVDLITSYVDSDDYKTCKENGGVLVAFLRYIGLNDIAKGARAPRNTSAPAIPSHDTSDDDASDELQKAAALLALLKGNSKPATIDAESVRAIVADEIEKAAGKLVIKHEIIVNDVHAATISGLVCDKFDTMLKTLSNGIHLYLYGPSGTGKSYAAAQLANALGYSTDNEDKLFMTVAKISYAEQLTGYMNAAGVFVPGSLYKAMKAGALLFIDEIDASDANALVALNAAIADGCYTFPNLEFVRAKAGFGIIAAGNTTGNGADNLYTGRTCLDASTKDRIAYFKIDYNEQIELANAAGNNELVAFVHDVRNAAKACAIDLVCSYRAIRNIATMEKAGIDRRDLIDSYILKGMDKEDASRLARNMATCNVYTDALNAAIRRIAIT